MKKILSLMAAIAVFSSVSSAMAEPSPYAVKGRYPTQTGLYIAPKILYSMMDIKATEDESDSVTGGGLAFGYNFYSPSDMFPVRMELEYVMREKAKTNIDNVAHSYGTDTFMLNGAIGINTKSKLTPYLTGGVGYAMTRGKITEGGVEKLGDDNNLAWSLGFDLTYRLNTNILLGLEYRYIDFGESTLATSTSNSRDLSAQEVIFAFRYKF